MRRREMLQGVFLRAAKRLFAALSKETHSVGRSFERTAARRSALAARLGRTACTFASRGVFFPPHRSPEKMI